MKTAEEILQGKPYQRGSNINSLPHYHHNIVVKSMKEYASEVTKEKDAIIEKQLAELHRRGDVIDKDNRTIGSMASRVLEMDAEIKRLREAAVNSELALHDLLKGYEEDRLKMTTNDYMQRRSITIHCLTLIEAAHRAVLNPTNTQG